MRIGTLVAAFAAMVVAAPHNGKREMIMVIKTETDIVWVTEYFTVTATDLPGVYTTSVVRAMTTSASAIDHELSPQGVSQLLNYTVMSSPTSTSLAPMQTVTLYPVGQTSATSIDVPASTYVASPVISSTVLPPVQISITPPSIPTTTSIQPPVPTTTSIQPPVPTTTSIQAPAAISTIVPQVISTTPIVPASNPTSYADLIVAHHNLHRRNHSAPDLVWDNGLAVAAGKIAASCIYNHNTAIDKDTIGGYGQNIAAGIAADNVTVIITELFYNGEVNYYDNLYGQAQPDMSEFEHWGHFSQIVWRDTSKVGCATQQCDSLQGVAGNVPPFFTVCNYQAPGNVAGAYTEVGASLHLPTVHWNYYS